MQQLDLPQALKDIQRKIDLIEERLGMIAEGIVLYAALAAQEKDELKRFQYKEQWIKKREEHIACNEQLHSQKVYLHEFENDLKNQKQLRQLQLEQMNEHMPSFLATAGKLLKEHKNLAAQDRQVLLSVRDRFLKNDIETDDEKISLFRELVNTLQKLTRS